MGFAARAGGEPQFTRGTCALGYVCASDAPRGGRASCGRLGLRARRAGMTGTLGPTFGPILGPTLARDVRADQLIH